MTDAACLRLAQVMAGAEHGGAENFYTRLVAAIAPVEGVDQLALTRNFPQRIGTLRRAGAKVECFRFGGRVHLLDHYRYRRRLREHAPDVVLTYMNRASMLTPPGNYSLACRLGHYYDLKYYRHADFWIGNTRGICDHLVRGGMPADRVECIPNFADESPVQAASRESLGVEQGAPLLLAAGRLHRNKAFDILIQALTQIPDAVLCLAGTGPEEAALRELAGECGVAHRVHFLGWRDDVAALMRAADLFVCPSRHEGLGNIVLEAWLHGCPIVATRSQGPAELIEHGVTGLLCPIDEATALARSISGTLANPLAAKKMVDAGAQRYRDFYSQDVIVSRYLDLFRQLAAERSRDRGRGVQR